MRIRLTVLHISRVAMLAAALVATSGVEVAAQRNPPTVPTVLATALLGGFAGATGVSPHFVVDREPAGWPRALRPAAPWKTVGGLAVGPIVIAVFGGPRTAGADGGLPAVLTHAGFRPVAGSLTAGFGAGAPPQMYCDDSTLVTLATVDSTASTRFIALTRMARGLTLGCSEAQAGGPKAPLAIPPLRAPSGVTTRRAGGGYGSDYTETSAQLDTTISVAAILEHYTGQLRAAGWTAVGRPVVDGDAGLQRLSVRDRAKAEWLGVLLVVPAGGRRQLVLRMARAGELE
jgi:hypothetical protein